jgi:hypothetical protein
MTHTGAFYLSWLGNFSESKINGYLEWDVFKGSNGKLLVMTGRLPTFEYFLCLIFNQVALFVIGTMIYITFLGHGKWYKINIHFIYSSLLVFFTGAGRVSLDNLLFKNKIKNAWNK